MDPQATRWRPDRNRSRNLNSSTAVNLGTATVTDVAGNAPKAERRCHQNPAGPRPSSTLLHRGVVQWRASGTAQQWAPGSLVLAAWCADRQTLRRGPWTVAGGRPRYPKRRAATASNGAVRHQMRWTFQLYGGRPDRNTSESHSQTGGQSRTPPRVNGRRRKCHQVKAVRSPNPGRHARHSTPTANRQSGPWRRFRQPAFTAGAGNTWCWQRGTLTVT